MRVLLQREIIFAAGNDYNWDMVNVGNYVLTRSEVVITVIAVRFHINNVTLRYDTIQECHITNNI